MPEEVGKDAQPLGDAPSKGGATRARAYRAQEGMMRLLAEQAQLEQRRELYLTAAARYALLAQAEEEALARAGGQAGG